MTWVYSIFTKGDDINLVHEALGVDYHFGALYQMKTNGGRAWRFEIDYRLNNPPAKKRFSTDQPGMAGFTEVSDGVKECMSSDVDQWVKR